MSRVEELEKTEQSATLPAEWKIDYAKVADDVMEIIKDRLETRFQNELHSGETQERLRSFLHEDLEAGNVLTFDNWTEKHGYQQRTVRQHLDATHAKARTCWAVIQQVQENLEQAKEKLQGAINEVTHNYQRIDGGLAELYELDLPHGIVRLQMNLDEHKRSMDQALQATKTMFDATKRAMTDVIANKFTEVDLKLAAFDARIDMKNNPELDRLAKIPKQHLELALQVVEKLSSVSNSRGPLTGVTVVNVDSEAWYPWMEPDGPIYTGIEVNYPPNAAFSRRTPSPDGVAYRGGPFARRTPSPEIEPLAAESEPPTPKK